MMQIDSMAGVLPSFSFEGDKSLILGQEANTEEEQEDIQLNEGQGEELLQPKKFSSNISLGNVEDDTFAGLDTSGFESFTSPALSHSLLSENISSSQLFGSNEHFSDPARGLAELAPQPNNTSVHHHHHHFMTTNQTQQQQNASAGQIKMPAELDKLQRSLCSQMQTFRTQLTELHRVAGVQKILTTKSSLPNATTKIREDPHETNLPVGMSTEVLKILGNFLKEHPRPTKKDVRLLLPQVNMGEQEIIAALKEIRKANLADAKQKTDAKASPQSAKPKKNVSPEIQKAAQLNQKLLELVDKQGGVSEAQNMAHLQKLMSDEKAPDSQSLLLNIISNTKRLDCKRKFVQSDGLGVLKMWILQAHKEKNTALLRQILKVIYSLPVTLDSLKSSQIGKIVKKLENHSNERIKKWVLRIMNSWKEVVQNAMQQPTSPQGASSTKKSEKHSDMTATDKSKAKGKEKADEDEKSLLKQGVKRPRESAPAVAKPTLRISASGDFDDLLAASSKTKSSTGERRKLQGLIPDHVKRRRHAVQLIEEDIATPHPLTVKTTAGSYKSRPLSADDIKKAKTASSATSPGSPPTSSRTPIQSVAETETTKRGRDEETQSEMQDQESSELSVDTGEEQVQRHPKKKKKSVSWAPENELVQVKTFEKYLSSLYERKENMSFEMMMQLEKQHERENADLQRQREEEEWKARYEQMSETVLWKPPQKLSLPSYVKAAAGENSREANIQKERQNKILAEFYSRIEDIPDTPTEPDEPQTDYDDKDVVVIPLEEMYIQSRARFQSPQMQQSQPQVPRPGMDFAQSQSLGGTMGVVGGTIGSAAPSGHIATMPPPPSSMPPGSAPTQIDLESALNNLLSNPSALSSILGDTQALNSILSTLPPANINSAAAAAAAAAAANVPNNSIMSSGPNNNISFGGMGAGLPPFNTTPTSNTQQPPLASMPPNTFNPGQPGPMPFLPKGLGPAGMQPFFAGGQPTQPPPMVGHFAGNQPNLMASMDPVRMREFFMNQQQQQQQPHQPPPQQMPHLGFPGGMLPPNFAGAPFSGPPFPAGGGAPPSGGFDKRSERVCSFWGTKQGCRNGDNCPFQHINRDDDRDNVGMMRDRGRRDRSHRGKEKRRR